MICLGSAAGLLSLWVPSWAARGSCPGSGSHCSALCPGQEILFTTSRAACKVPERTRGSRGSSAGRRDPILYPHVGPFGPFTFWTCLSLHLFSCQPSKPMEVEARLQGKARAAASREAPGGGSGLNGGGGVGPGTFQGRWHSGCGRSSGPSVSLDLSCFLGHFAQKIRRRVLPISTRCPLLTLYPQNRSHPPSMSLVPSSACHLLSHWCPQLGDLLRQASYFSHFTCEERSCSERLVLPELSSC